MKRLLSAFLFVLILLSLAPLHQSFAANWVDEDYAKGLEEAIFRGGVNSPGYASHMNTNYMNDITRKILGPVRGVTITYDAPERNPEYVKQLAAGSAISGIGTYIAMMYTNPPANTYAAIRDFGQSLGFLPKQAYAQGVGFTGLQPLLGIWRVFRNIAYLLLAVVMVAIGFMVMFRKKIDPKTVVTVQNALPRIVVTLLLITFSYAIVGFLIDLMYLFMLLFISLLVNAYPGVLGSDTASNYIAGGLPTASAALFWGGWAAIDDLVKMIFWGPEGGKHWWFGLITSWTFPGQYIVVWLIVSVALLFGLVRIFFLLLTSYIQIIIGLLVGPLQLLFDAFPGGTGFSPWIKNLISNLSVFPITAGMFLIGTVLTRADVENLWTAPLLPGTRGITGLIGLGILLTIPSVAGSIKEALKAKSPIEVGPGAIAGPLGAGVGQVVQLGHQLLLVESVRRQSDQLKRMQGTTPVGRAREGQQEGVSGKI